MALLFELMAQLDVIEDFTVKGDPEAAIVQLHGLLATGEINDAETGVAEGCTAFNVQAVFVRAAVRQGFDHALEGERPERG